MGITRNSLRSVVPIQFLKSGAQILGKIAQPIMGFVDIND